MKLKKSGFRKLDYLCRKVLEQKSSLAERPANCAHGFGALFAELPTTLAGYGELTDSPG